MSNFFLILMGFFIVVANVIGFISYKKKKNLYFVAFAIFYGLQVGYYLLINSVIVFFIAILATVIKRYNNRTT